MIKNMDYFRAQTSKEMKICTFLKDLRPRAAAARTKRSARSGQTPCRGAEPQRPLSAPHRAGQESGLAARFPPRPLPLGSAFPPRAKPAAGFPPPSRRAAAMRQRGLLYY